MNMTPSETERGFALGTFQDRYGAACSIQKSSLATEDAIWLGVDLEDGKGRMHLTQDGLNKLLPILQRFVETGELTFE
jgi:hypothetical protein